MKKLPVFLTMVLFTSLCTIVYGQRNAPGYMGKKFVLMYEQGISWSFGKTIRAVPNFFYTISGDYAITKKYSVGGEYSFRTRYYGPAFDQGFKFRLDRSIVHKVGIYSKLFSQRNGHIAPAGPYLIVGAHFHFIQSNFLVRDDWPNSDYYEKNLTVDFAPFIGGGKQYIVANGLMFDVSIRVSLPLITIVRGIDSEVGTIAGNPTEQQQYNRARAVRAVNPNFEANILELRVGFGGVL